MSDTFSFQPNLYGENIALRPLQLSDFEQMFDCASDKEIWVGHPNKNRYQKSVFHEAFDAAIASKACLVIIDQRRRKAIGWSRFYAAESVPQDICIGFTFLAREYWGGVTNLELKTLMLNYAFNFFSVVWFHIAPSNIRSQKATQRIGAEFVAEELLDLSGKQELWLSYKMDKAAWSDSLQR